MYCSWVQYTVAPSAVTPVAPGSLHRAPTTAAAGMAVGHLAATVVEPAASPVTAIGAVVVDATPTPVKEWAVATLGTADKPILIATVVLVTVVLSAGIGLLARRWRTAGLVLLVVLVTLAGLAGEAYTITVLPLGGGEARREHVKRGEAPVLRLAAGALAIEHRR